MKHSSKVLPKVSDVKLEVTLLYHAKLQGVSE